MEISRETRDEVENTAIEKDAATLAGSSAFSVFTTVAEQIGATTKRLEKAFLLGQYFSTLSDDDLAITARYFAGYTFPLRDQRTTNVGGAALLAALTTVTQLELGILRSRLVALGDLGDVAAEVFPVQVQPSLTLEDVAIALEQLANTSGSKRKVAWVINLLEQATPLEAKYLIKLLSGDLRIGLREGMVEDAITRLFRVEIGQIQWVNMLTGDIGETALLARHDRLNTARMRLFHPIKFMLASPAADLDEVAKQMPAEFVVEDKFDGIRAQVHIAPAAEEDAPLHGTVHAGMRVALFSRTLDEITATFPDLIAPLANIRSIGIGTEELAGLVLDGEIVPIQGAQILPFQQLQKRLGRKTLPESVLKSIPVAFIAYDVLYSNGNVLVDKPFRIRRNVLDTLHLESEALKSAVSQRFQDVVALDDEFIRARDRGNEGLMIKDPNATYKPGRRGKEWLKIKRAMATLDVVVTAAEVGTGKRSRFLSDYTFAVRASETDPTLLNLGKAYSGLTDAEVTELSDWFRAHTLQEFAHGRVRLVEPQIVLEVTFDRIQVSKRHKSGYALRFPRILRIRTDKPAAEIDTLETVRRLAEEG